MIDMEELTDFIRESNKIEGIFKYNENKQVQAYQKFLDLKFITVDDLIEFVSVIQPDAVLRDKKGLDVRVGNHVPLPGGPAIKRTLAILII